MVDVRRVNGAQRSLSSMSRGQLERMLIEVRTENRALKKMLASSQLVLAHMLETHGPQRYTELDVQRWRALLSGGRIAQRTVEAVDGEPLFEVAFQRVAVPS